MRNDSPFTAGSAVHHILDTQVRRETLTRLCEGLGAREPFLLVTGEPGVGKTTLVRDAVAAWGSRAATAFVTNPALSRSELVEEIARRFGAEPPAGASKPQLLACLERVLADVAGGNQVAVLVVDDAHDLAPELLEELRLIANTEAKAGRALEVLLAGLPILEERLADPAMVALRQRVAVQCALKPLSQKETRRHLQECAGSDGAKRFPRDVCREIFRRTHGVPRAVNTLADAALRLAGGAAVTVDDVASAAEGRAPAAAPGSRDTGVKHTATKRAATIPHPDPTPPAPGTPDVAPPADDAAPAMQEPVEPSAGEAHSEDPPDGPAVEAQPAAAEVPEEKAPRRRARRVSDPRVSDWVSRFIGEDEPRFGSRFQMGALDAVESVVVTRRSGARAPDAGQETAPSTQDPGTATGGDRPPARGAALRGARRGTRGVEHAGVDVGPEPGPRRSKTVTVAIGFVGVAALAAVILLPRIRQAAAPGAEATATPPAAVEDVTGSDAAAGGTAARVADGPASAATARPAAPKTSNATSKSAAGRNKTAARATSASPPTGTAPSQAASGPAVADGATAPEHDALLALDVGTYINADRAAYERTRLADATGLSGWIVKGEQDGVPTYKVVLGVYSSPERARKSADLMLSRGLVTEALTIPLPPRSARQ